MKDEDARALVRATMTEMGMDPSDPAEMQRDFVFLRGQRIMTQRIGIGVRLALIGGVVSGALAAVWLGIKAAFNQP